MVIFVKANNFGLVQPIGGAFIRGVRLLGIITVNLPLTQIRPKCRLGHFPSKAFKSSVLTARDYWKIEIEIGAYFGRAWPWSLLSHVHNKQGTKQSADSLGQDSSIA